MESVDIQLQQIASKNWTTMGRVANVGFNVQQALDSLKRRFPDQAVRAMLNGSLINMIPQELPVKYVLQVGVEGRDGSWEWRDVSPSHADPYIFESYDEAANFLDQLYPTQVYDRDVRIVEVNVD